MKELRSSSDASINDEGLKEIDNTPTVIDASNFLFTLQQPTKKHYQPDYKLLLDKNKISPDIIPNSEARDCKTKSCQDQVCPNTKNKKQRKETPQER